MCDRGAAGSRGWPPDWSARRRGAADTARAAPPSYGFGRAQGHRRPIARGGHHGQATERGARAVVDGDRRLTPLPDARGEIGHLRGIAFVGPYPRTRRTQPRVHAQPLEILGERAHALRENLHPLPARRLSPPSPPDVWLPTVQYVRLPTDPSAKRNDATRLFSPMGSAFPVGSEYADTLTGSESSSQYMRSMKWQASPRMAPPMAGSAIQ